MFVHDKRKFLWLKFEEIDVAFYFSCETLSFDVISNKTKWYICLWKMNYSKFSDDNNYFSGNDKTDEMEFLFMF